VVTHGILVLRHDSHQSAPTLRVLLEQVEADLLDAARIWHWEVDVWDGRPRRACWPATAD